MGFADDHLIPLNPHADFLVACGPAHYAAVHGRHLAGGTEGRP
ncbi:hypothetical protein [Microtetraspora sp. NBRC 16547]|nr:hypothetical protein [Microtetraspora sp. NBRC 16547]GLX00399.1 hypothetical protein Misp02_44850 [Microtetraspora sp. NBRC 16547]